MADPEQLRLLELIANGDGPSRAVYADWLEEHGRCEQLEFLTLQDAMMRTNEPDHVFARFASRMRDLARSFEVSWRTQVARRAIDGCSAMPCPADWGKLAATEQTNVRRCAVCQNSVHYCLTEREAAEHAVLGHRITLDIVQIRTTWRCATCHRENVQQLTECFCCGAVQPSVHAAPRMPGNPPPPGLTGPGYPFAGGMHPGSGPPLRCPPGLCRGSDATSSTCAWCGTPL